MIHLPLIVGSMPDAQAAVAAVLAPCSALKSIPAPKSTRASSLPVSDQRSLEENWLQRLRAARSVTSAASLYEGRGFRMSQQAALALGAPIYVISAGLGLVHEGKQVPSYGITVSGTGPEGVRTRVQGRFDPAAWWRAVSSGPFSIPLWDAFSRPGLVLVAMSRPYAEMLVPELERLSSSDVVRVRIMGVKPDLLPSRLAPCVLRYDDRMDLLHPGTKIDFAARVLLHFANEGLAAEPDGDIEAHQDWVQRALSAVQRRASGGKS